MDILLIGSRGREHALCLALKRDKRVGKIYCIPGNGGLSGVAECVRMSVTDKDKILGFLNEHHEIEMTVISPDETLAMGLCDYLNENGHRAFGPDSFNARMETDKSFCRSLCARHGIPAPEYKIFNDYAKAKKYVEKHPYPLVVKTNGRTAGKGIFFCRNYKEAENALYDIMIAELFGEAGKSVDIEEYLDGHNVIVMVLTDGKTVVPLPAVKAYKRVFDGDLGMNTAGMGAYLPADSYTPEIAERALNEIFIPTVKALAEEGTPYKGVLSFSLLLTPDGPKAADFIVRFCDVESQVVIPLLETPIVDIFNAIIDGKLSEIKVKCKEEAAVCVVLTSGGYPLEYNKNVKINIGDVSDVEIFHAGTKLVDGELRTSGGRVLGVLAVGASKSGCADKVYKNIGKISFDGMHYRKDIAKGQ